MKPPKRHTKAYRYALRDRGLVRQDRFAELMETVLRGPVKCCWTCRLQRPVGDLDDHGICFACRSRMTEVISRAPEPSSPQPDDEPHVVYVDASFRDGYAGLAVVGALGQHSDFTEASSSTHAEVMALHWAISIAKRIGRTDLIFRTDCHAASRAWPAQHLKKMGWTIEQVPRRRNQRADMLAGRARSEGEAG